MSSDVARRGLTSQMAAIFFVTAAALLFQVAQTRLFSAAFGYHLTYLVISVSLLGVGWGATLSAVFDARPGRPSLGHLAVAAAGSIVIALLVETHVDPMSNLALAVGAAYLLGFPPISPAPAPAASSRSSAFRCSARPASTVSPPRSRRSARRCRSVAGRASYR